MALSTTARDTIPTTPKNLSPSTLPDLPFHTQTFNMERSKPAPIPSASLLSRRGIDQLFLPQPSKCSYEGALRHMPNSEIFSTTTTPRASTLKLEDFSKVSLGHETPVCESTPHVAIPAPMQLAAALVKKVLNLPAASHH